MQWKIGKPNEISKMDKYAERGGVVYSVSKTGRTIPLDSVAIESKLNRLTQSEATLKAKVAELEKIIEQAPHSRDCSFFVTEYSENIYDCDCFKSRA